MMRRLYLVLHMVHWVGETIMEGIDWTTQYGAKGLKVLFLKEGELCFLTLFPYSKICGITNLPLVNKRLSRPMNFKVIVLSVSFVFVFSSIGYGPISAWAQESVPGTGLSIHGPNGTSFVMHNPCFPNGSQGHRTHGNQHGNQTNYVSHSFGLNSAMRNGTHYGQYGNHGGFKMPPCATRGQQYAKNGNSTAVPQTMSQSSSTINTIPSWIRNNAKWWSQGQMGESDIIKGVQYIIHKGILKITSN